MGDCPPALLPRLAEPLPSRHKASHLALADCTRDRRKPSLGPCPACPQGTGSWRFGPLSPRFSLQYCPRLGINDHILFRGTNRARGGPCSGTAAIPFSRFARRIPLLLRRYRPDRRRGLDGLLVPEERTEGIGPHKFFPGSSYPTNSTY